MAADYKRPDEAAMQRILERYPYSPEGAIIRLAWLQGLSRKELNQLTWDQVDFANRVLLLPERTVPMAEPVAECLQKRWALYHEQSERVVIAGGGRKPMTPENVSRLAKIALDSENQTVSLMDLRHDWLLRQIRENGWAYAAKVSGLAVSSLRGQFGSGLRGKQARRPAASGGQDETEYILWRIVQQEGQLHCRTGHLDVLAGGDAARRGCRADVGSRWISTGRFSACRIGRSPWARG